MKYNIVAIVEKWSQTGFLDSFSEIKQKVDLAMAFEKCARGLTKLAEDDDLPDGGVDSLSFNAIINIFESIHTRHFHSSETTQKVLSNNLKMANHKLNVKDIINITIDTVEKTSKDDINSVINSYDVVVIREATKTYLIKYGTLA